MKTTLILVFSVAAALAVPLEEREYSRYVQYSDDDGMHTIDLEAEPDMNVLNAVTRDPANNAYLLFTRRNPTSAQTLIMNNANSIISSNFNAAVPTVVIVHGWLGNQDAEPNPTVRAAYLDKSDVNIITVDWRRLALSDYVTAALGVPEIGRGVGQFLLFLNSVTGAPFNRMHLVGFSLGAHVVGNAGREVGGRVARVTGLDPAGSLWYYSPNRLSATDGVYTESIHTDGDSRNGLGIGTAITDVDFFPNGGNSQPGCYTNICNHNRAWELFAASVTYNHLFGQLCTSTLQITLDTCRGATFPMGNDDLNKRGSGMYRLDTARSYPY